MHSTTQLPDCKADGHTAACNKLFSTPDIGCVAYNLGTGKGTSVLEMIKVCLAQHWAAAKLVKTGC